jgi:hypothetical protein
MISKNRRVATLALTLGLGMSLLTSPLLALAHDDTYLDTVKAPNGGQLRMAGMYHFELVLVKNSKVAQENPVLVYVTDHAGTKFPTLGASGTVTLLAGKDVARVTLVPDGDNRLKGMAKYASSPNMKAVVAITMAGKAAEQARFTPMTSANDEHMHH